MASAAAELLAAKKLRRVSIPMSVDEDGTLRDFTVRALSRPKYQALIEDHPPTTEDEEWNIDTFPAALISASLEDPKMTVKQAQKMWDEWEPSEMARLFTICWELNNRTAGVSFTLPGYGPILVSGLRSDTASTEESPTPSS